MAADSIRAMKRIINVIILLLFSGSIFIASSAVPTIFPSHIHTHNPERPTARPAHIHTIGLIFPHII